MSNNEVEKRSNLSQPYCHICVYILSNSPLKYHRVPMRGRLAIHSLVIVVFARNSSASMTLRLSPFGVFQSSLEYLHPEAHAHAMSTKEIVRDLLQKLPEDASLYDVAREIEFVAAVRQGLAEIDGGDFIPIEEIDRELPSWVIK